MRCSIKASSLHTVLALLVLVPATASAQDDATAQARELFSQGVACVARQDWACAEERFRAALALRDAPAVRYNLASAIYEQGRYPEAAELNAQVLANPETNDEIRRHATELQEALADEGARARVVVSGAPDDAELRVDGYAVPRERWEEVPVAAGERTFALFSGDRQLTEVRMEAEAGQTMAVALTVVASPEEAAGGGGGGGASIFEDPVFWGIAGGTLALVTIIVIIVAVAATSGGGEPFMGDFQPGVLTW